MSVLLNRFSFSFLLALFAACTSSHEHDEADGPDTMLHNEAHCIGARLYCNADTACPSDATCEDGEWTCPSDPNWCLNNTDSDTPIGDNGCPLQGITCAPSCVTDVLGGASCVNGAWVCPDGYIDTSTCGPGTCPGAGPFPREDACGYDCSNPSAPVAMPYDCNYDYWRCPAQGALSCEPSESTFCPPDPGILLGRPCNQPDAACGGDGCCGPRRVVCIGGVWAEAELSECTAFTCPDAFTCGAGTCADDQLCLAFIAGLPTSPPRHYLCVDAPPSETPRTCGDWSAIVGAADAYGPYLRFDCDSSSSPRMRATIYGESRSPIGRF